MEARKKELPKVVRRVVNSVEPPLEMAFDPEVDPT